MKRDTRASIRTRFRGPTNYKGPRIIVTDDGPFGSAKRRLVHHCDGGSWTSEEHELAAQAWLDTFNPGAVLAGVGLAFDGDYYWTWHY